MQNIADEDEDEMALAADMEGGESVPRETLPNVPRVPPEDDPRAKIKAYANKMAGVHGFDRGPERQLQDNNADLAFMSLLNQSANQMGTLGGKAASSAPADQFSRQLQGQNQQAIQGMKEDRQTARSDEDRQVKIQQYLADRMAGDQEKTLRRSELAEDKKYRRGMDEKNFEQRDRQIEATMAQAARKAEQETPQAKQRASAGEDIGKKVTNLSGVRSELASALKQLKDPLMSDEDKLRVADGIVKTINMTQGTSDAIGQEEVGRLASELKTSLGALGSGIKYGAGAGAATGAALAGIPTLGIGAPVGAGIGALGGGILGAGGAALDEMSRPGGIKFSPDIPGFTSRTDKALEKVDATIRRQTRLQELIGEGKNVPEANAIIDQEEGTMNQTAEQDVALPAAQTESGNLPSARQMKIIQHMRKKYGSGGG